MKCKKCKKDIPAGALYCCWCGSRQCTSRKERANGEGTVFLTKSGKWKVEVNSYQNGKRLCLSKAGFRTKKEAVEYLPVLRSQIEEAKKHSTDLTVQQLYDILTERWLSTLCRDKATQYRTAWKRLAPIHKAKLRNLKYADLQPLIDAVPSGWSPKDNMRTLLHRIYDLGMKMDCVDRDYSRLLEVPPVTPSARRSLSPAEVHSMWEDYESGHKNVRYFLIMAYTGMRTGEMLSIQKQNVRLKEQYCTGGIKTEAGKARQIVFCDKIMPLILDCYHEGDKKLCELNEKALYKEWHEMAERLKFSDELTPYCCRHTAPTMLAEEGVQPAIIQQIMGHTSYSMTAEHYTHISLESKIDAVNKLK